MTRRYATPDAFKQAVEQRLRDQAAGDSALFSRARQLLVFDRFLARLVSVFGDALVLKGGLVVELRLEQARTTKDIDLRLTGDPDALLPQLQDAGRLDLGDFLQFDVQEDPRNPEIEAEGMRYQGRRYRAEARLAGKVYGARFGVDVAFAEPMVGEVEELEGSRFLDFAGIEPATFRVYPLATHIAEKLHAYTLPRDRPNSRVKDLPDIALLATVRPLDAETVRSAIEQTFAARATHEPPSALPAPPPEWEPVYAQIARVDRLAWPTLDDVYRAAAAFLDPMLAGGGAWDPETWTWRPDA